MPTTAKPKPAAKGKPNAHAKSAYAKTCVNCANSCKQPATVVVCACPMRKVV